jgi:hypothetical protein
MVNIIRTAELKNRQAAIPPENFTFAENQPQTTEKWETVN